MPYFYGKIVEQIQAIDAVNRPTFIIDKFTAFVFSNHASCVSEWFASISSAMDNSEKTLQMLLLQPDKKDQLSQSDASYILHLCPQVAIEAWIKSIKELDSDDWSENYQNWLENFTESDQQNTRQVNIADSSRKIMNFITRQEFVNLMEHPGLVDEVKVEELLEHLRGLFGEDLSQYWDDILITLQHEDYGDMDANCLNILKNLDDTLVFSFENTNHDTESEMSDDSSDESSDEENEEENQEEDELSDIDYISEENQDDDEDNYYDENIIVNAPTVPWFGNNSIRV